ncbi:MAG: 6-carboxytetrahydropterin synthase [Deltaproteobacteria bacterium]|nr:6-carboxytetrahydropterin synthase [Deltaproteobacteria bacterium]
MFQVTRQFEFCYGHRLLDYQGKCAHPHGHNGLVEVEFSGQDLDHRGMLIDFTDIKKELKDFIEEELDHKMLLRKDDPLVDFLKEQKEPVFIMQENPTAENIAELIFNFALSKGLPVSRVRLWETRKCYAEVTN